MGPRTTGAADETEVVPSEGANTQLMATEQSVSGAEAPCIHPSMAALSRQKRDGVDRTQHVEAAAPSVVPCSAAAAASCTSRLHCANTTKRRFRAPARGTSRPPASRPGRTHQARRAGSAGLRRAGEDTRRVELHADHCHPPI